MLHRLRQLKSAIHARIFPEEAQWIRELLNPELSELFFAMDLADQRHCLDTAQSLLRVIPGGDDQEEQLLQAALLHDCGKAGAGLTVYRRGLLVLARSVLGEGVAWFAREGQGWRHILWNHLHHPQLGAALAQARGAHPQVVELIRIHQVRPRPGSCKGHMLLYRADQAN